MLNPSTRTFSHPFLPEIRDTLLLAGPVVFGLLAQNSMTFVDTVMVGRLGGENLAGVALGSTVYSFLHVMCMGAVVAVGPMASQAFGANNPIESGRAAKSGFILAVLLALPAMFILWNVPPLLTLMGQDPEPTRIAQTYLQYVIWGFPAALLFIALRSFVEAVSRPWPVTAIAFIGVGVNVVVDYAMIFGRLGMPRLGAPGAAIATSISYWVMFILLAIYVASKERFHAFRVFHSILNVDLPHFRELFRIGWPIGISHGVEVGLFVTTALMMGIISTTALAAHQIAIQCASLTFMVPLGVGIAASVRVGQAVGRRDTPGIQRAGLVGILVGAAFMTISALLFLLFPLQIIALYLNLDDPANLAVVEMATVLLGAAAVFQIFDGIQVASGGCLRGLKDTRMPMLIGLVSYWGIGLSSGSFMAFVLGYGAPGLWWGLVLGLLTAAILLSGRFFRTVRRMNSAL